MNKILYAEDHPGIRKSTERFLQLFGYTLENDYRLIICENGQNAEQSYFSEKPLDVAILDNTMPPGKTGRELAKIMKQDDPGIRIFIASGDKIPESEEYCFLEKPFDLYELDRMLKGIFEKKMVL
ncbi:MAG: response regulator [Candidatus Aenigmarchaeota archaeon]|nr:response regulator [Candidatus Aenigmarchaeota archaeon]